jgi:hypothetical protein
MSKLQIERKKRLSQSLLWDMQRRYFDEQGIEAWAGAVPYFVTSNCYAAECYANIVMNFIADWVKQHKASQNEPFYVIDLGAGPGQFSFYVLKKMHSLKKILGLESIKIQYVMSDITDNTIAFWQTQEVLQPFLKEGLLDFANYNIEDDKPLHLINAKRDLLPKDIKTPVIAFANYLFDSVTNDVFRVVDDRVQELRVSLHTEPSNMSSGRPIDASKVDIEYHACNIPAQSYTDNHFQSILQEQIKTLKNTYLLMPIGALNGIKKLNQLANGQLLFISSDKGYTNIKSLDSLGKPHIATHGGCISLMVNFYAIQAYFKRLEGGCFLQTPRRGIKTLVCYSGMDLKNDAFPCTQYAVEQYLERFSLADYFSVHRHVTATDAPLDLGLATAHLKLSGYDPYVFSKLARRIQNALNDTEYVNKMALKAILPKVADTYYFMPKAQDTNFDIALYYHSLKDYSTALDYYKKSRQYFGSTYNVYYNSALCAYYAGDTQEALDFFKRASAINPNAKEAQEWMMYLGEEEKG